MEREPYSILNKYKSELHNLEEVWKTPNPQRVLHKYWTDSESKTGTLKSLKEEPMEESYIVLNKVCESVTGQIIVKHGKVLKNF